MRRGARAPYEIAAWIGRGGWGATAPFSAAQARSRPPPAPLRRADADYKNNTWPKILAILMGLFLP